LIEFTFADQIKFLLREIWHSAYDDKKSSTFLKFKATLEKNIEELYKDKKNSGNQAKIIANLNQIG
jgi:hypothetical protein